MDNLLAWHRINWILLPHDSSVRQAETYGAAINLLQLIVALKNEFHPESIDLSAKCDFRYCICSVPQNSNQWGCKGCKDHVFHPMRLSIDNLKLQTLLCHERYWVVVRFKAWKHEYRSHAFTELEPEKTVWNRKEIKMKLFLEQRRTYIGWGKLFNQK